MRKRIAISWTLGGLVVLAGLGTHRLASAERLVANRTLDPISYDTSCSITSAGSAQRRAFVRQTMILSDDDAILDLSGTKNLTATGATFNKSWSGLSTASASFNGGDCNTWAADAAIRVGTTVKVVATTTQIDVDITTKTRPTEHFHAHSEREGEQGPPDDGVVGYALYLIPETQGRVGDPLTVTVPFTVLGTMSKIEVVENKLTRTETIDGLNSGSNVGEIEWWIFEEDTTNCVASSDLIDTIDPDSHEVLTVEYNDADPFGSPVESQHKFCINLPISFGHYNLVLVINYKTTNKLSEGALCDQSNDQDATLVETFLLTLKPM